MLKYSLYRTDYFKYVSTIYSSGWYNPGEALTAQMVKGYIIISMALLSAGSIEVIQSSLQQNMQEKKMSINKQNCANACFCGPNLTSCTRKYRVTVDIFW